MLKQSNNELLDMNSEYKAKFLVFNQYFIQKNS